MAAQFIGDFNAPLSTKDRSSKQRINKDIVALNDAIDGMHLIDICRIFHHEGSKYTFLSNAYVLFSKVDCMVGNQTNLNKFKKIEITSNIFLDHNGLKLETKLKEKNSKTFKNMETI